MKSILFIPMAAVVALPAHFVGTWLADSNPPVALASSITTDGTQELTNRIERLREKNRSLEALLVEATKQTPAPKYDDGDIAAALAPWISLNDKLNAPDPDPALADVAIADMPMPDLLQRLGQVRPFSPVAEEIYRALRKAKRLDDLISAVEDQVHDRPDDSDLRVLLGVTYLQKLFTLGMSMESGKYAMMSDRAFDDALEIDPRNVNARFTKGMSLSNWPEFLGKTKPAIEQFEILIEQLEEPGQPNFAQPYLYLGNMYARIGKHREAKAAWEAGLKRFPGDERILEAMK